jgi:hypothetical protein
LRLFFQDEARIGQKGRVCHRWFTRGQRPPGLADKRFTFAYLFAAIEPGTDNDFALVMPETSTATMQIFLDEFAKTIAPDEHVALVLDQTGWHGARALTVPDSIRLVPLPPYSPEFNPVERVWLYLKGGIDAAPSPRAMQPHLSVCASRCDHAMIGTPDKTERLMSEVAASLPLVYRAHRSGARSRMTGLKMVTAS